MESSMYEVWARSVQEQTDHIVAETLAEFGLAGARIERLDATGAWKLLADGQVARGSMAPKVEAAAAFAGFGGTTMIGSLDQVEDLLAGRAGTVIVPHGHRRTPPSREGAGDLAGESGSAPMAEAAVSERMGT